MPSGTCADCEPTRPGLSGTPAGRSGARSGAGCANLVAHDAGSLSGLVGELPDTHPEWMRLAGYLTVAETYFCRDGAALEALERQVLPALIAARRAEALYDSGSGALAVPQGRAIYSRHGAGSSVA